MCYHRSSFGGMPLVGKISSDAESQERSGPFWWPLFVARSAMNGNDLAELTALAESAGAVVVDRFQQKIRKINPATYLGKGKAQPTGRAGQTARGRRRYLRQRPVPGPDPRIGEDCLGQGAGPQRVDPGHLRDAGQDQAGQAAGRVGPVGVHLSQRLTRMWSHLDTVAGVGRWRRGGRGGRWYRHARSRASNSWRSTGVWSTSASAS